MLRLSRDKTQNSYNSQIKQCSETYHKSFKLISERSKVSIFQARAVNEFNSLR
jgi:hypothetical protein